MKELTIYIKSLIPSNYRCYDGHNYKLRPKHPFDFVDFKKLIKKLAFLGLEKQNKYTYETDDYLYIQFDIKHGTIYVLDWTI